MASGVRLCGDGFRGAVEIPDDPAFIRANGQPAPKDGRRRRLNGAPQFAPARKRSHGWCRGLSGAFRGGGVRSVLRERRGVGEARWGKAQQIVLERTLSPANFPPSQPPGRHGRVAQLAEQATLNR